MKAIIASVGGRVPPAQNTLMLCAGSHSPGAARGPHVPGRSPLGLNQWRLQWLTPVPFLGRDAVAHAAVLLGLFDPSTQGLGNTANLPLSGHCFAMPCRAARAMAAIAPACVSYEP